VGVAVLVLLVAARFHLKWRIHRAINDLAEAGGMTRFEDFFDVVPAVPDDENMVVLLTNAASLLPAPSEALDENVPYIGLKRAQLTAGQPWPAAIREAVAKYIDEREEGFALVTEALRRPHARYFSDYDPSSWDLSALSNAKRVAWNLRIAAEYEMECGNVAAAADRLIESYAVCGTLLYEPLVINQLVAVANVNIARPALEQLLGAGGVAKRQIAELRAVIQANLERLDCGRALAGLRAIIIDSVAYHNYPVYQFRTAPKFISEDKQVAWNKGREMFSRMFGVIDADLLLFLETMNAVVSDAGSLSGQVRLETDWGNMLTAIEEAPANYVTLSELENMPRMLRKFIEFHIQLTCADLALAVEQFRNENDGELPGSLESLVPGYIATVANEPRSEKPFELIRYEDGYGIGRGTSEFRVVFTDTPIQR